MAKIGGYCPGHRTPRADGLGTRAPPMAKVRRHTVVAWGAASIRRSFWARLYDQQQRAKGKAHPAAVRALAFTWRRILYRWWQDRTPYEESV